MGSGTHTTLTYGPFTSRSGADTRALTVHSRCLPGLDPRYSIFEHKPLRPLALLLFTREVSLGRAHLAAQGPLRSDEEDVRMGLPPSRRKQPVVRAHYAPLEVPEERTHEVLALELKVAALRARRDCDGHAVLVQVLHEPHRARERLHVRPALVLPDAPLREIAVDGEVRGEVGEEGEQVGRGVAFSWVRSVERNVVIDVQRTFAHESRLDVPCHLLAIPGEDVICAVPTQANGGLFLNVNDGEVRESCSLVTSVYTRSESISRPVRVHEIGQR